MKDVSFSNVMGYRIINENIADILDFINCLEKVHIVSGNPEVLDNGIRDKTLYNNFNSNSALIIPDGIGTIIASKLLRHPIKSKVAGIELMEEIIKKCETDKKPIYLLGAKQDILDACIINLKKKYKNIIICGSNNGYFDVNNCENIINDINKCKPYALFVAMGCPRQEKFIVKHFDKLPCKIFMGVGGSFDIFAHKLKRAPKWMIDCGLEWLYRVVKEPYRIKRLFSIPIFIFKAVIHRS